MAANRTYSCGPWPAFAMFSGTWIAAAGLLLSYNRNSVAAVAVISGSALIGLGALYARSAATPAQKATGPTGRQPARAGAPKAEHANVVERIIDREVERKALEEKLNRTPPRIRLTHGHVTAIGRFEREAKANRVR